MLHRRSSIPSINTSKFLKRRYLPRLIIVIRLLIVILVVYLLIVFVPRLLTVRHISCLVENGSCPTQMSFVLSKYLGKSLLTLDRGKIKDEINEVIKPEKLQIESRLNGELIVRLSLSSFNLPVLVYQFDLPQNDTIDQLLLDRINITIPTLTGTSRNLTRDGVLIDGNGTSNLIIINSDNYASDTLSSLSLLVSEFGNNNITLERAFLLPQGLIVYLSSAQVAIFSLDKPPRDQIYALQQILSTATIKTSQLIDLRFNRPIVK